MIDKILKMATLFNKMAQENNHSISDLFNVLQAVKAESKEDPGLLSIKNVRTRMDMPKEQFDSAMLDLQTRGILSLHHHDAPFHLSDEDRDKLVFDGKTYYIGAMLKHSPTIEGNEFLLDTEEE